MTNTPRNQVTVLESPPARADFDDADSLRNDARGGYHTRSGVSFHDAEPSAPAPDPSFRAGYRARTDASPRDCGPPSYLAAFLDIAPVLPMVGTIATVFAYVGGPTALAAQMHQIPLVIGATSTLALGLVTASLHRSLFTAPEHAHPRSFAEIRQRIDSLAARLRVLYAEQTAETPVSQRLAFEEAVDHCRTLDQDLARGGPQWIVGTGYVDAMTRLHRAEEALIAIHPATDVLAGAIFDELRIAGSTMPDRDDLLAKLQAAVRALRRSSTTPAPDRPAERAFQAERAPQATSAQTIGAASAAPSATAPADALAASSTDPAWTEDEARIVLREIRRALNDFRDESRARLIRSRSRLVGTMTLTGAITYVLLAFAVNLDERQVITLSNPIVSAASIYLVGAVVGLFNRLHLESGDDAAGEDYGLSKTRLLLTPMLSGLAAVGGVLITGMLSGILDVNAITPTPAIAADLGSKAFEIGPDAQIRRVALSLHDIFNLRDYPFSLVLAAMFGLTPKTFLKRLHQASEQSKLDLKSTAASRRPLQSIPGGKSPGTTS